ncbi:MAG: DNA replication/repair protein RecF [Tissierellia bacterium]|nr:DNA replication/repair protein RecF [Tissierellia bacterium]
MIIEGIKLINFRNYNNLSVLFNPNINIMIGRNAQGKTNLLEAIYICSTGRSFRTSRDREIIKFEKGEAYVGANLKVGELEKLTEIKLHREKSKRIKVNKIELKSYKELNTGLKVVVFSPEDLKLIKEGPNLRRSYLDSSISQLKPLYYYNLNRYYKILIQRNNLLKSIRYKSNLPDLIEVFDIQMARFGSLIILERESYINRLLIEAKINHNVITKNMEILDIQYLRSIEDGKSLIEIETCFLKILKESIKKDIETGTTNNGPHRDDFAISINGKDSKTYASQGQQRSIVLTLKLSEVEMIKKDTGYNPILLLDDVYSELDEERRIHLTKLFSKMQTFITLTDAVDIDGLDGYEKEFFYINDGCIYSGKKTWREVNGR